MSIQLPLIVGFGGYNAAGRSSGHQAYSRMIIESLNDTDRMKTIESLAALMGLDGATESAVLESAVINGTLIRKIEPAYFDVNATHSSKQYTLEPQRTKPISFRASARDIPKQLPAHWQVEPLDEAGKQYQVTILDNQNIRVDVTESMPVKAAGQLPSGFDPGAHYRSQNHPRGLQLAILGASDAVSSMGLGWHDVMSAISPDDVAVYSSSVMSQLDSYGFGGMLSARRNGGRVTSKQLALGLNTMPADFINAYVLGSVGSTGGITGACATFLYNLKQGAEDIRSGRKKVVVVGGSEAPIIPEVIDGYAAMSALATDADLSKLDGVNEPDYRRASRPFGSNCGFTLAESTQYAVLMADDLAMALGAKIYGGVPNVFVNADGHKKSISAPGAGNYVTMAKAVGWARSVLGEEAIKSRSFVQAHGSSTPQNRVTESKIFDEVAKAFGISNWPVAAIKSYVGHSLGPASGDQLSVTLGIFEKGILPGVKTIDSVASDVFADQLNISNQDTHLGVEACEVGFLNSKGFGGNNATAPIISPTSVKRFLKQKYGEQQLSEYLTRADDVEEKVRQYADQSNSGKVSAIYEFGTNLIDETQISISKSSISLPGYKHAIRLDDVNGFEPF